MNCAPAISLKSASLRYENVILFDQLNFTVNAGKCSCLLGPSGVGKTSLLRLIAGLHTEAHSENPITTSDHLPLTGRIAYMAQQDLLLPWCNVIDNVLLGPYLRGKVSEKQRQKALYLLAEVGLTELAQQKPANLSGGQRQRVALARTLMEDHPVVLMDEPFASLDVNSRRKLQNLTAELLRDRTVLLVTHDPLEALRLGDEIYVMQGLPATISAPLIPPGKSPRDLTSNNVIEANMELLKQLLWKE
jgi:putative hydroxymethylpyrimidine transport system ATP-binding protein